MPFYFYRLEKIKKQISQLEQLRYKESIPISEFLTYPDDGQNALLPQDLTVSNGTLKLGDHWKGKDQYLYLSQHIQLPTSWKDQIVLGIFDFGITGDGYNSGFESLCFVNGQPYQGVDSHHKEVFFDLKETGLSFSLHFRLWSGLPGGGKTVAMEHQFKEARCVCLDKTTDQFYYLTKNVFETIEILDSNHPDKSWLEAMLVEAFKKVDFSYPGSTDFYQSIQVAYDQLANVLQTKPKSDIHISLIGHTHIDVAWLWRLRHTREKAARSFSTVHRLMNQYEHYIFLQSQAQLYDFIKHDYPMIYEHIQQRVKENKWEPGGSMWVECDCNLVSGESLVRQILYGKQFFKREFGVDNDYLWLPDVFGYSWALPQILKKSNIHTFVTTKISWNDTDKLPYDTFKWKGIDGSEVLTHFITTPEHFNPRYYTYNGLIDPYTIKGIYDNYSNKDLNNHLLIAYGYGDGGGGVTRDMLENIKAIQKIPSLPHVQTQQAKDYFHELHHIVEENPRKGYIPTWDGELYLEFHRGTYTSQARNKKANRQVEYAMKHLELLLSLAKQQGSPYPQETLLSLWKVILCHQFHDIIPGSSIHEVYEDSKINYQGVFDQIHELKQQALNTLINHRPKSYTIFNPTSFKQASYIEVPEQGSFIDGQGHVLESHLYQNKTYLYIPEIDPLSFKNIYLKSQDTSLSKELITIHDRTIDTPFYHVELNPQGQLDILYDKEAQRDILTPHQLGNVFQIFEDKPREFDAWELEASFEDKMDIIDQCTDYSFEQIPGLMTILHLTWTYRQSMIQQDIIFYTHSKRIDFKTHVEWYEREKLLKVKFPVDFITQEARYDIQFGNIARPITRNTSWQQAQYEVVGHKWALMQETDYGLAIMNDCKYGHDFKKHQMRLTLLKASNFPDEQADLGQHDFTYALYPYQGTWQHSHVEKEASLLNEPLMVYPGEAKITCPIVQSSCESIHIDTIKKAEESDDIILRIHEYTGARKQIHLDTMIPYASIEEVNLLEEPIQAF